MIEALSLGGGKVFIFKAVGFLLASCLASAEVVVEPDYEREKRWADQILPSIMVGEPVWQEQSNGHKFLGLYTQADAPRGAIIVGHGRGWSPDWQLYGAIRMYMADLGYSTLSIQLPVLGSGAKVGDYIPTYPDSNERYELSAKWLYEKGYPHVAIVSHSLGATMANQYLISSAYIKKKKPLIKAWVFISIINGLEEMFRIKVPVLDLFGSEDWVITRVGAYERKQQIMKVEGSNQIEIGGALHFFEGKEDELSEVVVRFLDKVLN